MVGCLMYWLIDLLIEFYFGVVYRQILAYLVYTCKISTKYSPIPGNQYDIGDLWYRKSIYIDRYFQFDVLASISVNRYFPF